MHFHKCKTFSNCEVEQTVVILINQEDLSGNVINALITSFFVNKMFVLPLLTEQRVTVIESHIEMFCGMGTVSTASQASCTVNQLPYIRFVFKC